MCISWAQLPQSTPVPPSDARPMASRLSKAVDALGSDACRGPWWILGLYMVDVPSVPIFSGNPSVSWISGWRFLIWPLTFGSISSSHGVQIVPDSPTNQSSHLMVTHQPQMLHWVSAKVRPTHSARNPWEFDLGRGSRLYQGSKIYVARIVMWLKQSWLPSPCHHHFYRWYGYHVTMPSHG